MANTTLTRERIAELREMYVHVIHKGQDHNGGFCAAIYLSLDDAEALLSAAESALELQTEMRELRRTVAKHHGEAHAAREERDRLQDGLCLGAGCGRHEVEASQTDEINLLRRRVEELEEKAQRWREERDHYRSRLFSA